MTFIARIYVIKCDVSEFEYIGSTKQQLSARMSCHRRHSKIYPGKLYNYMREVGIEHFRIVPVLEIQCETMEDQRRAEDKVICERQSIENGLNTHRAHLTPERKKEENRIKCAEHFAANKELYRKNGERYRTENKDVIIERKKKYYENGGGREKGIEWRKANVKKVRENWNRYYSENAERLKAKSSERYHNGEPTYCDRCKVSVSFGSFKKHTKSKKHANAGKPKPTVEERKAAQLARNRTKNKESVYCKCCDSYLTKVNISRHNNSKKHISNFISF